MDYSQAAAEFRKLKAQHDTGALTETDFKARLEDLMVQDEQGRWWMIGSETGQWYVHDGEKWVRAKPPIPGGQPTVITAPLEMPPVVQKGPEKSVLRPQAQPPRPWLRIGVGIVAAIVVIAVIAQLAGRGQSTPTPAPIAAPTRSSAPAKPDEPTVTAKPTATTPNEDIKLAILAPLSGPVPTFGVMTRDGALLAIDEWNAKGGVLGRKIVPVIADSQCTPDPAVNAANKVIDQDKVRFIIGEVCSKATIPVSEIANAKKIIQISPTSTNEGVTVGTDGKTKDYIFRACFIDPFQGKVGAKFALENLKAKTAFIMLDQANDYVKGLAENFERAYTAAGGKIVGKETYTGKDTDFSAILAKVAAAKPDVIYLPDYYNIVNLAAKQAKEKGITAPFLGGDGWDSSDLDLKAAAGGYFTNHYSPDSTAPEVVSFLKNFKARYKNTTPDALAALAYDATNLLLTAIKNAGTDDTTKVKTAMEGIIFQGVSGKITFDKQHNPVKSATILKISDKGAVFDSVVNP